MGYTVSTIRYDHRAVIACYACVTRPEISGLLSAVDGRNARQDAFIAHGVN
jgi:hypothetical protein